MERLDVGVYDWNWGCLAGDGVLKSGLVDGVVVHGKLVGEEVRSGPGRFLVVCSCDCWGRMMFEEGE